MDTLFKEPQRQSAIGILILFFDTIRHYVKAFWAIVVLWVFKIDEINTTYLLLGMMAAIVIVAIIAYFTYINFTFHLDYENQEFVIHEGIFNKTRTTVQLNKIQQVNINQSLVQRMIGVYALDVDTAGSNAKEGKIKAISHPIALELKAALLDNEKRKSVLHEEILEAPSETDQEQPFIKISTLSLIKMGVTSNYVKSFSLLLLAFFTILDYTQKIMGEDVLEKQNLKSYVNMEFLISTFFILIVALFITVLVINLGRILIKYFDYSMTKQKGSLLISFGLFNTKSTIIKPEKVQIAAVSQNYFQKKMNILALKIKQATSGAKEERKLAIEIPGCNLQEKDAILKLLFHKIPEKGIQLKPNYRKLGFALFLTIGLPLLGFYIFRNFNPTIGIQFNYLVPVYILFVAVIQFFKFKNNRLYIHNDHIIKQSGAWDICTEIIEPSKIQAITTSQLFWHKNINIGSLTLHTAGGNIAFQLGNFTTIKQYVNWWLYELETSDSNWM